MARAAPRQSEKTGARAEVLAASLSPGGVLRIAADTDGGEDGLTPAARAALLAASERGAGHAVVLLGLDHPTAALAPSLAFVRDLGRRIVTRMCADPDLEARRERVAIEPRDEELAEVVAGAPPFQGAEYLDVAVARALWREGADALRSAVAAHRGPVADFLHAHGGGWNAVGRVCFHLAENRADPEAPFAFLATYAVGTSAKGGVKHAPLSRALAESSASGDRASLLSLLVPVKRAAEQSALVAELLDSEDLFHPLAWTPAEAHRFLREIPPLESAGVVVRVPDWWRARRPASPEVTVRIGQAAPGAQLGAEAMLDFRVEVTLDGEPLTEAELRALMQASDGLVLVRGRWVELDRERLRHVLDHWRKVERAASDDGLSFLDGMRLLAGAPIGGDTAEASSLAAETRVEAGPWLAEVLAGLRGPEGLAALDAGDGLAATLRPYQEVGARWLAMASRLGLGVCLADDMGLGKTIQVLALWLAEKRGARRGERRPPHLLVVPASLLGNWQAEAARFAPSLRLVVAHPSVMSAAELAALADRGRVTPDVVMTTYGQVARTPWFAAQPWSTVVLDEAQAIKNPGARQTRAVKALPGRARIALTGTPVENRLGDLWSLFDFLSPGLLGTSKEFSAFVKRLAAQPSEPYAPLRRLVQPYLLRRLKTDRRVVDDLPDKTEVVAYCGLARPQAALYQRAVEDLAGELARAEPGMKRRGLVLSFLVRLKQICNHPSQWLGDGAWAEADSGKLARLRELCEGIASRQEKVLVFTQFREVTAPLAGFLEGVFGRAGLVLHGETAIARRTERVAAFQADERIPFFVLSLKAGGTGLNLTSASHVIHFDRWWNPAVENQATDRAYRIGQKRNVMVHKLVCRGTIEERIDELITAKQGLADEIVAGGADRLLTEMGDRELMEMVALDLRRATQET